MSFESSLPDPRTDPGRLPVLEVDAAGDGDDWVAGQRSALRGLVAEHGALMLRGLGLRDAAGVPAVVAALGARPVTEREAFASRQRYAEGIYSSSTWPANQPMCMHHELSYRLEIPGLLLFACVTAPASGGATAVADAPTVLEALPDDLVRRFEREGWLLT